MLEIKDLVVSYGVAPVLKGIDISISKGNVVSLLGANGAGKTTTLNTVSGLLHPESGSIKLQGKEISQYPADEIVNMGIAQVPEGREVFPGLTVEENLKIGAYSLSRNKKDQEKENLEMVYDLFPHIAKRRKQLAGTLSGGEQQMLVIGRGLMINPSLLLLDEPSLGLAPVIISDVFDKIVEIKELGTTIFLVEQNANLALQVSDYAYCLALGEIAIEGSSDKLLNNDNLLQVYLKGNLKEETRLYK